MRIIYSTILFFMILFSLVFIDENIELEPPKYDSKLSQKTQSLLKESMIKEETQMEVAEKIDLSPVVWDKNMFDPNRGKKAVIEEAEYVGDVELMGICSYGSINGAILNITSQPNGKDLSPVSSINGVVLKIDNQRDITSGRNQQVKIRNQVYMAGDILPNGMLVKSIKDGLVELQSGFKTIILKVKFDNDNSRERMAQAMAGSAQNMNYRENSKNNGDRKMVFKVSNPTESDTGKNENN